ncbi:hypothetical protein J6590_085792 [Homalodisca vitripennis]|nr:hypothetical protein J6590_085792 [Homalodisca vitripennis]
MEDKGRNGPRNPPKKRPGQEMLKEHPGPPPGPIGTGMSKLGHPATKLCQQQTKYDKVTLTIQLPAKWLTNLVEGEGQGPPTSPASKNAQSPREQSRECLFGKTKNA